MLSKGAPSTNPTKIGWIDPDTNEVFYLYYGGRAAGAHYQNEPHSGYSQLLGIHNIALSDMAFLEDKVSWTTLVDSLPVMGKWVQPGLVIPSSTDGGVVDELVDLLYVQNPAVRQALVIETAPFWEQNLVYTYIAETYLTDAEIQTKVYEIAPYTYWSDVQQKEVTIPNWEYLIDISGVAADCYENGAADVQDELSPYFDEPDVQAAFAESALYLSLDQDQQFIYSQMSRDDQYAMLFESPDNYTAYIQERHAFDLLNMSIQQIIENQYHATDLTAIGNRLASEGIDGYAWFREMFEEQTSAIRHEAIYDAVDSIVRLYYGVLGRAPEQDGLEWWVNTFNTDDNKVIEQMGADFAWSKEFLGNDIDLDTGPTPEQFITAMYENVLGRAPDEEGYVFWLDKAELAFEYDLRSGTVPGTSQTLWLSPDDEEVFTFGRIVTGFTESEEYTTQTRADVYASEVVLWGANLRDLVNDGEDFGFTQNELIGTEVAMADFFLVG